MVMLTRVVVFCYALHNWPPPPIPPPSPPPPEPTQSLSHKKYQVLAMLRGNITAFGNDNTSSSAERLLCYWPFIIFFRPPKCPLSMTLVGPVELFHMCPILERLFVLLLPGFTVILPSNSLQIFRDNEPFLLNMVFSYTAPTVYIGTTS